MKTIRPLGSLVKRHHAGAAKAKIVLDRVPHAFDLGRSGRAAQLPRQFVTLCEAGRPERMSF